MVLKCCFKKKKKKKKERENGKKSESVVQKLKYRAHADKYARKSIAIRFSKSTDPCQDPSQLSLPKAHIQYLQELRIKQNCVEISGKKTIFL